MIPYARPDLNEDDVQAVTQVLRTDWLTQGPMLEKFEKAMADYCQVKYAVAVAHATAGLHLAYLALGLKDGQKVWTSPNTFVSTANAAFYCGGTADFVDIDPKTYNMSVASLTKKLDESSTRPAIIAPVHFSGQPCDMPAIHELARERGIAVVEDAAHAIGARFQDRPIGSCEWSDAAVFSFHAVKIMTTGEGGMILTNRDDLHQKLLRLRTHGITRDESLFEQASPGAWYYEQLDLGYHYRMTDIQAALGLSQSQRIDAFVQRRRALARRYDAALADLPLILPWQDPRGLSSWHLYVVRIRPDEAKKSRAEVFRRLRAMSIGVNVHYIPVHLQPHYRRLGYKPGDFPKAERYSEETISLPMFSKLTDAEQDEVIAAVKKVLA